MPADPVRSPSSIPDKIECEFEDVLFAAHHDTPPGVAALHALRATAPKLYAHWAEGLLWKLNRLEAQVGRQPVSIVELRKALGLEDRT